MSTVTPYLFFAGRMDEALEFYQQAIGAQVETVMRYHESPTPIEWPLPPGYEQKVMHCSFLVGETRIMASDGDGTESAFGGFQLAITVDNEAEARQRFDALAAGGRVVMPLAATFWSPLYGMLIDRFGVGWMIMVVVPQ
jgi:PhnB protein